MTLFFKRDDLLHPTIQGNKWRKLLPALERAKAEGHRGVLSFGGAFSNSLHALAHAAPLFGLKSAAILRGVAADFNNPTLSDARAQGMELFPVSKAAYDLKMEAQEIQAILARFPDYAIVPEGGAGPDGVRGCMNIAHEIRQEFPDIPSERLFVAVPAGTGCTAAGIVAGLEGFGQVLVFPAANYGIGPAQINFLLKSANLPLYNNYQFFPQFTLGPFAKPHPDILAHALAFEQEKGFALDPIYTARMAYGLHSLEKQGFFKQNAFVVAVHTGGLQGWDGMRSRF